MTEKVWRPTPGSGAVGWWSPVAGLKIGLPQSATLPTASKVSRKGGVRMDKLLWTAPQVSEIEVKMTKSGTITKQGTSVDAYSTLSGLVGSVVTTR
jgi:hypothetical protein